MPLTLEEHFVEQTKRLQELSTATTLIQNKPSLISELTAVQTDVSHLKNSLNSSRADLEKMQSQIETMKRLSKMLDKLKENISHMESNIPPKLLRDYAKMQLNETRTVAVGIKSETPNCGSSGGNFSHDVFEEDEENLVEDCKKTLFNEPQQPFPKIKLIGRDEFDLIPKYMIGRQSLDALNQFLSTINETLKAKYTLLALGKNGARKKGEFDLYMSYKKQENLDGKDKGKSYFFTAEDYCRHTKTKLDKTKLNFLTVLRHCKRLREDRVKASKASQYTVILP